MFEDTDLTTFNLIAAGEGGDQFPPTPPEYGWLIQITEAKKQLSTDGTDTSILFTGKIKAKSEWNGHEGTIRFFLTSKFPDSDPKKKLCSFAYALGMNGDVTSTKAFVNRSCIVYFESVKDGQYTRAKKWWPNTTEHAGRIAVQPLPTWSGTPNGQKNAKPAADKSDSIPF